MPITPLRPRSMRDGERTGRGQMINSWSEPMYPPVYPSIRHPLASGMFGTTPPPPAGNSRDREDPMGIEPGRFLPEPSNANPGARSEDSQSDRMPTSSVVGSGLVFRLPPPRRLQERSSARFGLESGEGELSKSAAEIADCVEPFGPVGVQPI